MWKSEFRQNYYRTSFSPTVPPFAARISRVIADGGTWRLKWGRLKAGESNGKLPQSTCPGCSVPEPHRSHDWALVPAKPCLQSWILMNEWFLPFWLRYLCLWSIYGFLGPMLRTLAGVLLKLGGYGLLSVFPVLFKFGFMFGVVWVALSLVGSLFVSLFCIWQTDLKSLIAYSSVAHIRIEINIHEILCIKLVVYKDHTRMHGQQNIENEKIPSKFIDSLGICPQKSSPDLT